MTKELKTIKNLKTLMIKNVTAGFKFKGRLNLSDRDREILLAGGLLSYTRQKFN